MTTNMDIWRWERQDPDRSLMSSIRNRHPQSDTIPNRLCLSSFHFCILFIYPYIHPKWPLPVYFLLVYEFQTSALKHKPFCDSLKCATALTTYDYSLGLQSSFRWPCYIFQCSLKTAHVGQIRYLLWDLDQYQILLR